MVAKRTGLARARKAAAYTQESLAEALHVDATTVGNWEQGRTEPLPYKRPKLANLLGITATELEQLLRPGNTDSTISASAKSDSAPDSSTTGDSACHAIQSTPSLTASSGVSQTAAPTHVPVDGDEPKFLMPIDQQTILPAGASAAVARVTPAGDGSGRAARERLPPVEQLGLATASQVADQLEHLRDQWHLLVKTDNLFGPRYALRGVLDQLQIIVDLLETAQTAARHEVIKLGAQYAESASWLFEDSGNLSAARQWNVRAMEWAHEGDDRRMLSWSLFRRSQQAMASGNAAEVIGLAQAAGRPGDELPSPMRAAITQQEAHGYALYRDESTARYKLDDALQWAATETSGDARDGHGSFCTATYIELQRATCFMTMKKPKEAIRLFEANIPRLPAVYHRDRGVALAHLADSYAANDEPQRASQTASAALAIARSAGSERIRNSVASVGRSLVQHQKLPGVDHFLYELATDGTR